MFYEILKSVLMFQENGENSFERSVILYIIYPRICSRKLELITTGFIFGIGNFALYSPELEEK